MGNRDVNSRARSFVTLTTLVGVDPAHLASSFERMTDLLSDAPLAGVVRFTLVGGPQGQSFTLVLREEDAEVVDVDMHPDLEVVTTPKTWLAVARGELAPLDAFTGGQMRIRGDYRFGQRIMNHLAAGEGRVGFC